MDTEKTNSEATRTPNFLRVAKELLKFKNSYKAADTLLLFIKDGMEDGAYTE